MPMSKRILQVGAGASLGLLLGLLLIRPGTGSGTRPGEQFLLPAPRPAADAELVDQTGEIVRLSELWRERTAVLFFGYTHCPDICPITMAVLGRARQLLGAEGERVLGVLISVDPVRDTPERLAEYLSIFPTGLAGLTGSPETLEALMMEYGIIAERSEATSAGAPAGGDAAEARAGEDDPGGGSDGYLIDHTGRSFVVHQGAVRMTFPPLTDAHLVAAGLKILLDP